MAFPPRWLNRQCIAFTMLCFLAVFLIISLSLPWYGIVQNNVPHPRSDSDTMAALVGVFYWTGYSTAVAPNYTQSYASHKSWDEFPTNGPKNIYMACMAFTLLALIFSVGLAFFVLVASMLRNSRRWFDLVCCGKTKWILFGVSLVIVGFVFLSWVIFFGFSKALGDDGSICPDPAYVGENRLWCGAFLGANASLGRLHSQYAWAPSIGWVFAVFSMVWALGVSFFLFIVKPAEHYQKLGEEGVDRHEREPVYEARGGYDARSNYGGGYGGGGGGGGYGGGYEQQRGGGYGGEEKYGGRGGGYGGGYDKY